MAESAVDKQSLMAGDKQWQQKSSDRKINSHEAVLIGSTAGFLSRPFARL